MSIALPSAFPQSRDRIVCPDVVSTSDYIVPERNQSETIVI